MLFPKNRGPARRRMEITAFAGLNRNPVVAPNEAAEMENLDGRAYPALSTRPPRRIYGAMTNPHGLFGGEELLCADGTSLYAGGRRIGDCTDTEKTFVAMDNRVLIFPDKLCYDTKSHSLTSLEEVHTTASAATFSLARLDGAVFPAYTASDTAPENPSDGDIWVDTGRLDGGVYQYSAALGEWIGLEGSYVRIAAEGVGRNLKMYDGITISGCEKPEFNGDFLVYNATEDAILVAGTITGNFTQEGALTVARTLPDLAFPLAYGNRLWAVCPADHTIRASRLGDPANFSCFMGLSTDSYAVEVGAQGNFTGSANVMGRPVFFTEDTLITLYGSKPSNFAVNETPAPGVAEGCAASATMVDETLFYVSPRGVYAFRGALPERVSEPLGDLSLASASAGAFHGRYYLSLQDKAGQNELLVYDAQRGLWRRQDDAAFRFFARVGESLYAVRMTDSRLVCLEGEAPTHPLYGAPATEAAQPWTLETGDLLPALPDHSRLHRVSLRIQSEGALRVEAAYDDEPFVTVWERESLSGRRSYSVTVRPRRFERLRLRLSGTGKATLYGMALEYSGGSEARYG